MNALSKQELAILYFPGIATRSATNRLCQWIRRCKPLVADLEAIGYNKRSRLLTVRELELIYKYLGEPT